jgi:hypothetical protein
VKRMLVLAAVVAAALPAAAHPAKPRLIHPWFHLGNRKVYCHADLGSAPIAFGCWRPASGLVASMLSRSVVHHTTTRQFRHYYEDSSPVLRKGKTWKYKGFTCKSSGTAVTCTNLHHHGWTLGAGTVRRFF